MSASSLAVEPAFRSVPPYVRTFGPEVSDLARLAGFGPDPEQEMLLDAIFAVDARGKSVAFETAVIACRQNLKALAVDTPLLTADGWRTMGSVQLGDEVFHPDGHLVTVTGVSDIKRGHVCYRVETTDGRSVIADAGHLWTVSDRRKRAVRVLTTQQMVDEGLARGPARTVVTDGKEYRTAEYRFQLPRQRGLKSPDADLPIDPYLLGAWLGDGTAKGARIASHADDVPHWIAEIERCGFIPTVSVERTCTVVGITTTPGAGRHGRSFPGALRRLGVLSNKHVPDSYLTAGAEQRAALLQGLMDTDGTIHHRSGQCTFTSNRQVLADAVLFLARSLGWRATLKSGRAMLRGRDCGPKYVVTFTPKTCDGWPPFRLARKASRVRAAADANYGRFTVSVNSIEQVPSVPVRCIKVGSADGLFLAGRDLMATHNTGLFKQAVLGWLFVTDERLIVWSAHEWDTVKEAFNDLEQLVTGSDVLRRRVKAIYRGNGDEAIKLTTGARLIFKTRTKAGGRGLSGRKVILDEGFALQAAHMGALLPTLSAQPDPQVLYGSSAGLAESAVLRDVRDRGRAGTDPGMAYFEWCAPPPAEVCADGVKCAHAKAAVGCGCDDPANWQRGNPAMGRRIAVETIAGERRALPPAEFGRERMGWWDDPSEDAHPFPVEAWGLRVDLKAPRPEAPTLAIAVTRDRSMSAIGAAGQVHEQSHVDVLEHRPGTGWTVGRAIEVYDEIGAYALVLDPSGPAGALEADLTKKDEKTGKAPFSTKPEAGERRLILATAREYAQACGGLVDVVVNDRLRHRDRRELNTAVKGVRTKPMADAYVWSRKNSLVDISPLEAVTLAIWGDATREREKAAPATVRTAAPTAGGNSSLWRPTSRLNI